MPHSGGVKSPERACRHECFRVPLKYAHVCFFDITPDALCQRF